MPDKTVREAMTASPKVVSSDTTVVDAARDDDGERRLAADRGRAEARRHRHRPRPGDERACEARPTVPVSDVGTENPCSSAEDPLDAALQRMAEQVRRLPVVEDGRLVGILAQADVSRTAQAESTGRMVENLGELGNAMRRSESAHADSDRVR